MSGSTATDLRATLVTALADASGTRAGYWAAAAGSVETLPRARNTTLNWRIVIDAAPGHHRAAAAAIALVQAEHPRVRPERTPSERSLG